MCWCFDTATEPPLLRALPPSTLRPAANDAAQRTGILGDFDWCNHWWPVQTLAGADPTRPHAVELLGRQLVLWKDGSGAWRAMDDACPHRLAPLSEGRLESDGTLQCRQGDCFLCWCHHV